MAAKIIAPQPGPQTRLSASSAQIVIFGGEAGGGKSWILDFEAAKWSHVPGYGAILFRRDSTQLVGPGSLWEKARALYPAMGARLVESPNLLATWNGGPPKGSEISFRHLIHEWTVEDHDGKEYAFVGIDEGQYFTERMIWYLWGRCRTMCGVKPHMRITCNPDPDCYLRTLLDWWIDPETGFPIPERDGVIRWAVRRGEDMVWFETESEGRQYWADRVKADPENEELKHLKPISIQFIRSRLADNKALLAEDPDYGSRLAMQDADSRAKKLGGNWNSRPKAGEMFNRAWFGIIDRMPAADQIRCSVRGWDKAASQPSDNYPDPDWTRGVLAHKLFNGDVIIEDIVSCRLPPGGVDALYKATAELDGPSVIQAFWQDPAQAGIVDEVHTRAVLAEVNCKVEFEIERKDKITYAKIMSAFADPLTKRGKVWLIRAAWNKPYLSELEKFPKPKGEAGASVKVDQVDASSRAFLKFESLDAGTVDRFRKAMNAVNPRRAHTFFTGR